ncbi:MAG: gamma-glutamyltranspeptidase / glutathione hydrolase [Acidobacteriota bacterium]|nr:gamma-glutamyltranspeptidase / glutathione hydrolase [Acidobacteriota bacterium]
MSELCEHALMRLRLSFSLVALFAAASVLGQQTQKPPLHGKHWMAITGKPLAATAGSMMFQKGGNAVDAAAAMLAATCTMWDTLSWGGETQALIYHPQLKKVIGINALGVAPTGATPEYYHSKGLQYPPEYGPLAAVTPGTPGGLMVMLAEYGTLSLKDVLGPAIEMADGYAIEAQAANAIERQKSWLKQWPYSRAVMLPYAKGAPAAPPQAAQSGSSITPSHDVRAGGSSPVAGREAPSAGEVFRQPELAATLRKLVESEQQALKRGKSRREAIMAAYDRFYKGDIAEEIARGTQEQGGLITKDDLAKWQVRIEEPVKTSYRGIDVYKLTVWTQGPSMLQALNILENFNLKEMGYNSARYIHTVYQALSLAYADRDFYYGDPYFPPEEPVLGLLSKDYAKERAKLIRPDRNDPNIAPGDPYPFQHGVNPFLDLLRNWNATASKPQPSAMAAFDDSFRLGTTSIEAADEQGWVVSVTPSGGWIPAVIAGRTGVGLSQRAQSFDTDRAQNPFNVIEPGKRPHVTLTPTLAMKDGAPYLAFAVQGGDTQDQNLLQFFLDVVEFGMTPQEATEAANFNTFQVRKWLGDRQSVPGRILLQDATPPWVRNDLRAMGYTMEFDDRTSGPINAIMLDRAHGTLWGGSSNHGEDYGIAW